MAKTPSETPAEAPFGVGLDIGTMNLIAARRAAEGVKHTRMRDVFLDLPPSAKKMLKLAKTSFVEREDDVLILGDAALQTANVFGSEARRPLSAGLISAGEIEAMEVLGPLCQFDYMGASEFEHGALPLALQAMAQNKKLTTFSTEVRVPKNKNAFKHEAEGPCVDTVYVLCPEDWRDEVTERIEGFAKKEDMRKTRCAVQLERSIRIRAKGTTEPGALGWIEINNGYAFFIDEAMWKGFCEIFEVAIPG